MSRLGLESHGQAGDDVGPPTQADFHQGMESLLQSPQRAHEEVDRMGFVFIDARNTLQSSKYPAALRMESGALIVGKYTICSLAPCEFEP